MPTIIEPQKLITDNLSRNSEVSRVQQRLEGLIDQLGPGGRLPRHTELMRQVAASQYTVLRALEELQRRGRIVRRHGSGTFVTDLSKSSFSSEMSPTRSLPSRTIVAITLPDRSIFDQCIEQMYATTAEMNLNLASHFVSLDRIEHFDLESLGSPYGFIVFRRHLAPIARRLQEAGHRVVLVGAPLIRETLGVPTVCGNHEHGAYHATKHLIELGHRNIAYVDLSGELRDHSRWQGHLKVMREAERNGTKIEYKILTSESIRVWTQNPARAREFFSRSGAPTAVAAWNDREALDLMATLLRAGLKVPDDVSLVGYDNLDEGKRMFPSLTTVDHLLSDQVGVAIEMITSDAPLVANEKNIFAQSLVVRESTAIPKSEGDQA